MCAYYVYTADVPLVVAYGVEKAPVALVAAAQQLSFAAPLSDCLDCLADVRVLI